jgi:hypothetical protein
MRAQVATVGSPALRPASGRAPRQSPAIGSAGSAGGDRLWATTRGPRGTGDEVIVCARRPDSERFRVPENLRTSDAPRPRSNLQRDKEARAVAATGPQSCSAVGPGGASGCLLRDISNSRVGMDGDEGDGGGNAPN